jgi:hypothetical protein
MKIKAHYRRGKLVSEHERKEPGKCIIDLIYSKCYCIKDQEISHSCKEYILTLKKEVQYKPLSIRKESYKMTQIYIK